MQLYLKQTILEELCYVIPGSSPVLTRAAGYLCVLFIKSTLYIFKSLHVQLK